MTVILKKVVRFVKEYSCKKIKRTKHSLHSPILKISNQKGANMPTTPQKTTKPSRTRKYLTYIIIAMFAVIVAKWVILEFVPSNQPPVETKEVRQIPVEPKPIPKEVTLSIDFSPLQKEIESEY